MGYKENYISKDNNNFSIPITKNDNRSSEKVSATL